MYNDRFAKARRFFCARAKKSAMKIWINGAAGLKKPRPAQEKKIENAIHVLGKELLPVEF